MTSEIDAKYNEKKRNAFFLPQPVRQVKGLFIKNLSKKMSSLIIKPNSLMLLMQREYWLTKNISPKDDSFFGYLLKITEILVFVCCIYATKFKKLQIKQF